MIFKCKCGKVKEFHSVRTMIKNGMVVSSAICDCGLGMEHVRDKDAEFPSAGVHKGSSNFQTK